MRIPALSAELIYFAGLSEADYFGNTKPCCTMQRVVQRLVMLNGFMFHSYKDGAS